MSFQDALARGRSEQAGYNPFEDAVDTRDYGVGGGGGEGEGGGGGKKKEAQEAEKALKEETEASVFQLTTRVAAYKRMVDLLGTRKDTQTHREKLKGMGEDISILAKKTTHALKGLKPKGKRRKTQHAKLLKDFQNVLAEFQNSQRACAEKERGTLPVKTPVKRKKTRDRNASASASAGYGDQTQEDDEVPLMNAQLQEQINIEGELEHTNAVIEEREQDIQQIQFQIGEVTEIFQDLAALVTEQGEVVEDIEANIVHTYANTEEANKQLKKAANHQKGARRSLLLIFLIVMIAALVVMMTSGVFNNS